MKRILHFVIPAFLILLSCFSINAQTQVGAASANLNRVHAAQPAPMRPVRRPLNTWTTQTGSGAPPSTPVTVVHVVTNGQTSSRQLLFINAGDIESENAVPGLGFDFPHLAAISQAFHFNPAFEHNEIGVNNGSFGPIFFSENPGFHGVPGLGFDYPHLAAISGHPHFNPAFEQNREGWNDNSFVPVFWGDNSGYSEPVDPSIIQQIQQEFQQQGQPQPQIIVIQQPAPPTREQLASRVPQAMPGAAPPSMASPVPPPAVTAPVRDVGEFIFVRRDGKILFASAFFIGGSLLQYVTPEGLRRTVPVTELDAEATRKMNEALGTTVDLHK